MKDMETAEEILIKIMDSDRTKISIIHAMKEYASQYKSAIEGAMRIKDLWAAPNHNVKPEHEGECQALNQMEETFEKLLKL